MPLRGVEFSPRHIGLSWTNLELMTLNRVNTIHTTNMTIIHMAKDNLEFNFIWRILYHTNRHFRHCYKVLYLCSYPKQFQWQFWACFVTQKTRSAVCNDRYTAINYRIKNFQSLPISDLVQFWSRNILNTRSVTNEAICIPFVNAGI